MSFYLSVKSCCALVLWREELIVVASRKLVRLQVRGGRTSSAQPASQSGSNDLIPAPDERCATASPHLSLSREWCAVSLSQELFVGGTLREPLCLASHEPRR